jgi:hypothetical protein
VIAAIARTIPAAAVTSRQAGGALIVPMELIA